MCNSRSALDQQHIANMKSSGMFLYVKLVMRTVMSEDNMYDIRNEINHLPEGLDEA